MEQQPQLRKETISPDGTNIFHYKPEDRAKAIDKLTEELAHLAIQKDPYKKYVEYITSQLRMKCDEKVKSIFYLAWANSFIFSEMFFRLKMKGKLSKKRIQEFIQENRERIYEWDSHGFELDGEKEEIIELLENDHLAKWLQMMDHMYMTDEEGPSPQFLYAYHGKLKKEI